jgi:hypothetical protein
MTQHFQRSYRVQNKGGAAFGQKLKENAKGYVKLRTDDLEISFGIDLGMSQAGKRKVACCKMIRGGREEAWEVLTIDPARIMNITLL